MVEAPQVVDQVLGAADGEGRDQHVAAILVGLLQDAEKFFERVVAAAVVAVAVGGLHQQHVGLFENRRAAHQRRAVVAQVAGEHQAPSAAQVVDIQLDDGRAEDVPGIVQGHADPGHHFLALLVAQRSALAQHLVGVIAGVQRGDGLLAAPGAPLVLPLGVLFLQVRGIVQHQLKQRAAGLGGEDRAAIAFLGQARQQSAMVDMGVGNHHRVDVFRTKGKGSPVVAFLLAPALVHAALKQDTLAFVGFQQVAGTGDLPDGAEKTE